MHLERNKFDAMAGPDGGNGGRGGHIKLRGNAQLWTLLHMRYYKNVLAKDGENGYKNNSTGHDGADQGQRGRERPVREASRLPFAEKVQRRRYLPPAADGNGNRRVANALRTEVDADPRVLIGGEGAGLCLG